MPLYAQRPSLSSGSNYRKFARNKKVTVLDDDKAGAPEVALLAVKRGQPGLVVGAFGALLRSSGFVNVTAVLFVLFVTPRDFPVLCNSPQVKQYVFFSLVIIGKKNNVHNK